MPPHPTTPDALHRYRALVAELVALEPLLFPAAAGVDAPNAAPKTGEIRDELIFIDDHWFRLTPQTRRLLAFVLGDGNGQSWRALVKHMPLTGGKQSAKSRMWEANKKIREESIERRFSRWPRVGLDGAEHLMWEWVDHAADIQATA